MNDVIRAKLLELAIEQAPNIIRGLKELFATRHPDLLQPTSEEVIAIEAQAFGDVMTKIDAWLAAHPE